MTAAGGAGIASGIMSAGSSISSAISQAAAIKSEAIFRSTQMQMNAQLSKFKAKEAIRMGETEAQQKALQTKKLMGRQRAVAAAQGIEVSDGSALDIQAETAGMGAMDIVTIRNNAWKQAWGFRVEASNDEASARMTKIGAKFAARSTLITGGLNAASSIMGGFASAGGETGGGGGSGGVGPGSRGSMVTSQMRGRTLFNSTTVR